MRTPRDVEEWLHWVIGDYRDWIFIAAVWLLLWLLSGCAATEQKAAEASYCDGCCFHIVGVDSEAAAEMHKSWRLDGCDVTTTENEK
jgi:hypothetical protein